MKNSTTTSSLAAAIFFGSLLALLPACGSDRIIYARTTKLPEESSGFIRIATEEEIACTIDGHEDAFARRSLNGYLVVSEEDLVRLLQNTQELADIRRAARSEGVDLSRLADLGRSLRKRPDD